MKTIEERAMELIWKMREDNSKPMAPMIEEAMRDLAEDCAALIDGQARGFQVLADHAPTPLRERDMQSLVHSLEQAAKEIRALSEGNQSDHLKFVTTGKFTPDSENVRRVGYSEPEPEAKPWPAKCDLPIGFRLKDPVTIKSTPESEAGPHLFYKCAELGHTPIPEIGIRATQELLGLRVLFCGRCKTVFFEWK